MTDSNQTTTGVSDDELRASVPATTGSRYVRLGLFVLLGFISFMAVLFLLTDPATFRGRYMLVTTLSDAGGVRRGDPIQMRGVNIGRVAGFEMTRDGRVDITMEIEGEWRVPEGSMVTLAETGVFGGRTVAIEPTLVEDYVSAWDTISGQDTGGGLLQNAGALADDAGALMDRMETLLDQETIESVQGGAREFEGLARELRDVVSGQRGELDRLTTSLANAAESLESVGDAGPEVTRAAEEARALLGELRGTSGRLDSVLTSLDVVVGRMERGEGTLGRLSADEALYESMLALAENLNTLTIDIRENPGRYIKLSIF